MFNLKELASVRFEKVSLRRTKDGVKVARMRMAVPLLTTVVLACPPEIKAAYEAIETRENKIKYLELDKVIPGVNVEFYPLPESKSISLALQAVDLDKLAVERGDGEEECSLLFTIEIIVEDKDRLRHWLVDNVFNQLWAKFEVAQLSLMPTLAHEEKPIADDKCPYPGCRLGSEHEGTHDVTHVQ